MVASESNRRYVWGRSVSSADFHWNLGIEVPLNSEWEFTKVDFGRHLLLSVRIPTPATTDEGTITPHLTNVFWLPIRITPQDLQDQKRQLTRVEHWVHYP